MIFLKNEIMASMNSLIGSLTEGVFVIWGVGDGDGKVGVGEAVALGDAVGSGTTRVTVDVGIGNWMIRGSIQMIVSFIVDPNDEIVNTNLPDLPLSIERSRFITAIWLS